MDSISGVCCLSHGVQAADAIRNDKSCIRLEQACVLACVGLVAVGESLEGEVSAMSCSAIVTAKTRDGSMIFPGVCHEEVIIYDMYWGARVYDGKMGAG